jgi:fructoselysine 6-kinase
MALADGELHTQKKISANVVDTLGAGDGFIAAFLKCRLTGGDIATCLGEGARFASRVCQWHGAFGHGMPWTGMPALPTGTDNR